MKNNKGIALYSLSFFAFFSLHGNQYLIDSATQAYIYAYPLVLMEVTKQSMLHEHSIRSRQHSFINQFINISSYPTYKFKDIVRPNVDTLYSFAWLDVSQEPIVLSLPDTHDRYYLMELLDAWTNVFASLGKRTTGTHAQHFLIVGPTWNDLAPHNMSVIKAPTNMVWILGRTQTNGPNDVTFVNKIQAGFQLISLNHWKKNIRHKKPLFFATALSAPTAPVNQVNSMDIRTFYTIFAKSLKHNPPSKDDVPVLVELKKIGIEPGKNLNTQQWTPDLIDTLVKGMKEAKRQIAEQQHLIPTIQGWTIMTHIGQYGTGYLTRAMVAYIGLGANLPQDAIYPTAFVNEMGAQLHGNNKYIIHFDKDKLPPVNAFWSITMYNAQSFLIKNPLDRYAVRDRDPLAYNSDGSLDIYIQHMSPGKDKESNWLPCPANAFNVSMRLYWPKLSVINGAWTPPGIKKAS